MFYVYITGNTSENAINTEPADKMTRKKSITQLNQNVIFWESSKVLQQQKEVSFI